MVRRLRLRRDGACTLRPCSGRGIGTMLSLAACSDDDSPTGTGTLSPLPGHQRSLGNASSLDGISSRSYSPLAASSDPAGPGPESGGLMRMFSGASGGSEGGSSFSGRDEDGLTSLDGSGLAPPGPDMILSRQRGRPGSRGAGSTSAEEGDGDNADAAIADWGGVSGSTLSEEGAAGAAAGGGVRRPGRRPPRHPRGNGAGGRRGCRVS